MQYEKRFGTDRIISTATVSSKHPQGGQTMIAAIYARKSTEQNGVGDEEKSVARQIEHAKAYAARKGWTVDEAHVYSDDGISGAEFKKRPGFLRLLNALSPRPPFKCS
jgi:DNA invertase Pin-like site-specific DNA recombinase